MALHGKLAAVYRAYRQIATLTDEATTGLDGVTRKVYQITDATKRVLNPSVPPTVKVNGTVVTTGYTVDYATGTITFNATQASGAVVLVSGEAFLDTPLTDEATTVLDGATRKKFQITDANKRRIDRSVAVTVKLGTTVISPSEYTIEYPTGTIVFNATQGAGAVSVTGRYLVLKIIAGCTNWNLDMSAQILDTTEWTEDALAWKTGQSFGAEGWNASVSQHYITEKMSDFGNDVLLILYANKPSNIRFEGYAKQTGLTLDVPVGALVTKSVKFQGDGPLYPVLS